MDIDSYPFNKLPFSHLFKTYTSRFGSLKEYYEADPFRPEAVKDFSDKVNISGDRAEAAAILRAFNKPFNLHEAALQNIKHLEEDGTLAIVTGQQLGVYGGPLYTVLKTISTIHLARRYERILGRKVVPVFWLADEDHDYDEIRSLVTLAGGEPEAISLPSKKEPLPPASELLYDADLQTFRNELQQAQYGTDFSKNLWDLLDSCFKKNSRYDRAFGSFIAALFSKHGLVLAGSNHTAVKKWVTTPLKQSVERAGDIRSALEKQSRGLAEDYHRQVKLYDSHLFYLDKENGRQKISSGEGGWQADTGRKWSNEELINEIETRPEQFSPDVFLRPILQDTLLPTLGYVAGPGEIAYYGQMKKMYGCFGMTMPVIFPRLSATIIEPAIGRIIEELPFEIHEYGQRIEDLESEFVERTSQADIGGIFTRWKEQVSAVSEKHVSQVSGIDPTLEKTARKAVAVFHNELNELKSKAYRAVKHREEIQINRIHRIQNHLFPLRSLQERTISAVYFMNSYDTDLWDRLLQALDENETFQTHKLIYL